MRWSRRADADMERIWHFLGARSVDLADRVEAAIRAQVEKLSDFPFMGQARPHLGIRELLISDYQNRVGYKIDDDGIRIVAVRSTRENR